MHGLKLLMNYYHNYIYNDKLKSGEPHTLRPLSITLQYTIAVNVLMKVATIAGAMIPAGFTLPYCCR